MNPLEKLFFTAPEDRRALKISVVIPTYNSSAVIRKTLESVFRQTLPPDEILVMDDGSKDDTVSILNSYQPKITVFQQPNRGVAAARNELCRRAMGDLVAFLDHDDLWHPSYLEVQSRQLTQYPKATAVFARHENFNGYGGYDWSTEAVDLNVEPQVIAPLSFIDRYNNSTGTFYSMSFCCIPKWVLARLGNEPFCEAVSGVDDCYLCNLLPLHGPVVFTPLALVAYRLTPQAQSSNQLKSFRLVVQTFETLEKHYQAATDSGLMRAFRLAFAGKRRRYGKTLMGAGMFAEARNQFRRSVSQSANPASMAKSMSLLILSYLPALLQPRWPSTARRSAA